MKHILTLASLVFATACFGQDDCPPLWTVCGPGTEWDDDLQMCIIVNPSDVDFDGCISISDFIVHLSNFGAGCFEFEWSCGNQISYQGYDYSTVSIGGQCWFSENLRSSQIGTWSIPEEIMHVPGSDSSNIVSLGLQYGEEVVFGGVNACPIGWHIPVVSDWIGLINHCDTSYIEGAANALSENAGFAPTNSTEFNVRLSGHTGGEVLNSAYFWTHTEFNQEYWGFEFLPGQPLLEGAYMWSNIVSFTVPLTTNLAFSIRCIKDSE